MRNPVELAMGFLQDLAVSSGSACTSASLEPSYVLRALGVEEDMAHTSLRYALQCFWCTGFASVIGKLAYHSQRLLYTAHTSLSCASTYQKSVNKTLLTKVCYIINMGSAACMHVEGEENVVRNVTPYAWIIDQGARESAVVLIYLHLHVAVKVLFCETPCLPDRR